MCIIFKTEQLIPEKSSWSSHLQGAKGECQTPPVGLSLFLPTFPKEQVALRQYVERIKSLVSTEGKTVLPSSQSLDLFTLFYLARAYHSGHEKIPFPKELILKTQQSRALVWMANKYLVCRRGEGWRGWSLITASALIAAVAALSFSYYNPSVDPKVVAVVTPLIALTGAWLSNAFSMCFTGTNTQSAGQAVAEELLMVEQLKVRYDRAAKELYALYRSAYKALALEMVNQIDTIRLEADFEVFSTQKEVDLFADLNEIIAYIQAIEDGTAGRFVFLNSDLKRFIEGFKEQGLRVGDTPVVSPEVNGLVVRVLP